jgi:hypothetical protein
MTDKQLLAAAEYAKRVNLYDRVVNTADRTKQEHDFSLRYPTPFRDELSPIARQIDLNLAWDEGDDKFVNCYLQTRSRKRYQIPRLFHTGTARVTS